MNTRSVLIVRQPRARLHAALVTRTWDLAGHLDEIASAELVEQGRVGPRSKRASHVWRAKAEVPSLLAPHVDDDHFRWTATVEWNDGDFESHWRIEPQALRHSVSCAAIVALGEALGGQATRVSIDANIEGLKGQQGVETIASRIVLVNWQKLIEAAVRWLDSD